MRRMAILALALATFGPMVGCKHHNVRRGCGGCGEQGCSDCSSGAGAQAAGHVAYPYYTLRGPRDFLYAPPTPQ